MVYNSNIQKEKDYGTIFTNYDIISFGSDVQKNKDKQLL